MPKRKKKGRKSFFHRPSNFHHFCPRSRIKRGDTGKFEPICSILVSKIKVKTHNAWHQIFLNMFAEEAINQVKNIFAGNNFSPSQVIFSVRKKLDGGFEKFEVTQDDLFAWETIFGNASILEEIENIIAAKWTYPGFTAEIADGRITSIAISLEKFYRKNIDKMLRKIFRNCRDIKIIPEVIDLHKDIVLKII